MEPDPSQHLFLGDPAYSSWSMRIGLLVDRFALAVPVTATPLYTPAFDALLDQIAPARTVPALRLADGRIVSESLAIAETLAEEAPRAGLWPSDPAARSTARALAAEMHAGFLALRSDCPMNLRRAYRGFVPGPPVLADLARLQTIWAAARTACSPAGPWLCGGYSVADAFFAPVAARIATYDLPVAPPARAYVAAHLADPAFGRWRRHALTAGPDQPAYSRALPDRPWPGPD